ncbi:WD40 repeat-like protein [Corynespora cassiicola Philippines]|uniref:WD40 repeat-like protein n=1 Tax=Corynespora cassiicola Philippines TaxID=1448308 RepID=A0A2T2N427_CORCC|nr:WD40 repeat-like protein [Corynespora cassiicola Philippines]
MAPPSRARSLPKTTFSATFSKLKTSGYTDSLRPAAPVSSSHYIRTLSWNASGTFIATGAADRTLRIWNPEKTNVKNSTELRTPGVAPSVSLERVAFHPINDNELASCSTDGMVRLWDVRSKASVGEVKVGEQPFTLAWTPDGTELVAGRKDNTLVPIDRATLKPMTEHRQPVQTNQCVFDWSGNFLYLTNGDGCVKTVRYPSFEPYLTLNAHTSSCYAVAMSPSGEYLAAGGGDANVTLWDTQEWICVRALNLTNTPVKSVDFSFDGNYLVAGSEDSSNKDEKKQLHIAHVESGDIVHTIDLANPAVHVAWHPCRYALAYSADSQGLKILLPMSTWPLLSTINPSSFFAIYSRKYPKMNVQAALNPTSLFSAKGLVVVITGGGSGIGLAIASALYQTGASKVYILGRRANVLEDAIKTVESSPAAPKTSTQVLSAITCDVTDIESVNAAVAQIQKETGYVDVLINNAGVTGPNNGRDVYQAESIEQLRDSFLKEWDGWGSAFAINTQSVVGVSAAFLPLLEAANTRRGWAPGKVTGAGNARVQDKSKLAGTGADADDDRLAHIITVASVASFMRKTTAGLAYNATKAGAAHISKVLSTILAEWGVRSNVVCPGPYPSVMTQGINGVYGTSEVPQGRMGDVNDIAGLALFLIGKAGTYINGTVQVTDGGRLAVHPSTY